MVDHTLSCERARHHSYAKFLLVSWNPAFHRMACVLRQTTFIFLSTSSELCNKLSAILCSFFHSVTVFYCELLILICKVLRVIDIDYKGGPSFSVATLDASLSDRRSHFRSQNWLQRSPLLSLSQYHQATRYCSCKPHRWIAFQLIEALRDPADPFSLRSINCDHPTASWYWGNESCSWHSLLYLLESFLFGQSGVQWIRGGRQPFSGTMWALMRTLLPPLLWEFHSCL